MLSFRLFLKIDIKRGNWVLDGRPHHETWNATWQLGVTLFQNSLSLNGFYQKTTALVKPPAGGSR